TSVAPSTSRSNPQSSNSDSIRTLFGNDVERKEPPDKAISPDSGVHSAENDPGDENDVHSAQNIINLITKLSPPLSPIKQRPSDKKAERERKEMETKEKERIEAQRREEEKRKEERERLEREQAEREERLKNEHSERKDRPSERSDKVKTGDGERQKPTENEHKSDEHASRTDGLRGEITLKGLDRSKLNQLMEIGRRTGRMKCMPRASSSQSHEGGEHSQNHRPSSVVGSHPSRNSFECAAPECVPTKPSRPVKPEEGSTEMLYDFYQSIGKSRKRKGDAEGDKVNKMLFYLDTSVYFLLSAKHFTSADSPEVRGNRQYSIIRDTNDLL
ncbi:hypothetical protein OSTOST_24134, partial [Ostertagia ostertagi]